MFGSLGLGLGLGAQSRAAQKDMILVYEIPDPNTNIELAIQANSTWFSAGQSVVINWGDGSANETVSAASNHTGYVGHTYASAGTYTIKISGSMKMYGRGGKVDILGQTLLTRIDSFGKLGITSFYYAFYYCSALVSVPKTLPDSVTDMTYMFRDCRGAAFNPDVSKWNVSKVTNMTYMFFNCYGAAFNPDVSNWNVSKVTNMTYMFYNCYGAAFNPDVSNWNVSKVTSMNYMFRYCSGNAFNPDMKSWTLKTGVTTTGMFVGSKIQPTTWLDELLIAWADNSEQGNDITISFGPNKFTEDVDGEPLPEVANALQTLEGKGWTITTANPYTTPSTP